ncbi:MAG: hypothetical protein AAGH65_06460 [Pseudomonadota bacterium]
MDVHYSKKRYMKKSIVILIISLFASNVIGQSTIDWATIDGGGEINSTGGNWQLSGTFAQWDSTQANQSAGGVWQLTGGFWALDAPSSDIVFKDEFE